MVTSLGSSAMLGHSDNTGGDEFCIVSTLEGANRGRSYYVRAGSSDDAYEWVKYLEAAAAAAFKRERDANLYLKYKHMIRDVYHDPRCEMFVALLIASSFLVNVVEVQMNPLQDNKDITPTFEKIDLMFTIVFLLELLVNMISHWFLEFWNDLWNIFDFAVVAVSVVALTGTDTCRSKGMYRHTRGHTREMLRWYIDKVSTEVAF